MVGPLLQYWRRTRNLSQLALANAAEISPRHLCFLETGRAKPSRDMVLRLADTLSVPLRERNALLLAAGFAPAYRESALNDPELMAVRSAIDAILLQQEPYPAVVMNRNWDLVTTNNAAARFFGLLLEGRQAPGRANVLRLMFHPEGVRDRVDNWVEVARGLISRAHREAVGGVLDDAGKALLTEVLAYPGVPAALRTPDLATPSLPVLPIRFRRGNDVFSYFSAIIVLGTPQDVTTQELRIECFFPSDEATAASARRLAATGSGSVRRVRHEWQ